MRSGAPSHTMLFNSLEFLFFFPVVTTLYFVLPHAARWSLLLIASCAFYMAFIPQYVLILFLTITIDYAAGIFIERTPNRRLKRIYLVVSLVATVLVLAVFKYFNFLNENVARIAQLLHWNYGIENLKIILPIGLSFHTFQSMSYVIEVYRGNQKAEKHYGIYALYVMFYPQLVAGPIERPQNLLPQFRERHAFDYTRVTNGLKLMAFGFFKKVVIADSLATVTAPVFTTPTDYAGHPLIIAILLFTFQIFCDFSGYSDIAIGSAQVMGFKLMENFNRPYASASIAEYWRRWHISLSTWFKDYVYIPLGGSRVSRPRLYFNLFVTFLISGLWHGANWTYVIWGAMNGLYIIVSNITEPLRTSIADRMGISSFPRLQRAWRVVFTFCLISFGWIFFCARSIGDSIYMLTHLFDGFVGRSTYTHLVVPGPALLFILVLELVQYAHRDRGTRALYAHKPAVVRWSFYYAMVLCILIFGSSTEQKFIYFQF